MWRQASRAAAVMVALATIGVMAPLAKAQPSAMASGETLRLQYFSGSTSNFPGMVASKLGFCTKHGFTCEMRAINAPPLALQSLVGKSIDVAFSGAELAIASIAQGSGLEIVATLAQPSPYVLAVRSDLELPHRSAGYPAVMQDLKGKRIGVNSRGTGAENMFNALLRGAGMAPGDVTYVGVGGPVTAYQAMTAGRLVDATLTTAPVPVLCATLRLCVVAVDLSAGDGPPDLKALNGAMIPLIMRREMVESNPKLVRAYLAAMQDAVRWARDPANFDALVKLYESIVSFGDGPQAAGMLRTQLKDELSLTSPGMETSRTALKAMVDFTLASKLISEPVAIDKLVWSEAP